MFGVPNKLSEYNLPLPPRSGWSGGTLDIPWTYSGTIDPLPAPIVDQARLSKSVSCGTSARSRCRALDVGGSIPLSDFGLRISDFPAPRLFPLMMASTIPPCCWRRHKCFLLCAEQLLVSKINKLVLDIDDDS